MAICHHSRARPLLQGVRLWLPVAMLNLSAGDRTYLKKILSLYTDANGRELLVGLTRQESERYLVLCEQIRSSGFVANADYYELKEKHELTRMRVIAAQLYLCTKNPAIH
ncbi:hypothetical protein SAMN04490203_2547 [Pseudomonas taetrolens]|uniref:Uncharacterized protein n=2 Tax=Pseudomonas taetrolens TaxID=47884 RepID=A0A1H4T400_PSETA|nr:hypothetical protein SAMN04490203_2547 [Pseudomonas taetrolens]SQF86697.1 Uncharacterised protein [Pseudomonas taetrolens]VEH49773.1 Uncharacterised protein [Pseudomonas taetrolens]